MRGAAEERRLRRLATGRSPHVLPDSPVEFATGLPRTARCAHDERHQLVVRTDPLAETVLHESANLDIWLGRLYTETHHQPVEYCDPQTLHSSFEITGEVR